MATGESKWLTWLHRGAVVWHSVPLCIIFTQSLCEKLHSSLYTLYYCKVYGKLWPLTSSEPLNRSSPNVIHVIISWMPINNQNLDAIHQGVSSSHICEICTLSVRMFTTPFYFCGFFQSPTADMPAQIFMFNMSVLHKGVPFSGLENSDVLLFLCSSRLMST